MTKKVDWSTTANVNFDDNRRKKLGILTGKEMFQKAHENLRAHQDALEQRKRLEPVLKSMLLNYMVSKTPLKVLLPIQNPTEKIGGLDDNEEDDGFYANMSKSNKTENVSFQIVMEVIPPGTELIYKSWDKQLRQWIFKGSNGKEYAIYQDHVIMYNDASIENPGLMGLLFSTNLVNELGD